MVIKNIPVVGERPLDSLKVYLCVSTHPQSSITEISERTGLRKANVSYVSAQYANAGIFDESDKIFGRTPSHVYSVKNKNVKKIKSRMAKLYPELLYTDDADAMLDLLTGRTKQVAYTGRGKEPETGKTDAAAWG